VPREPGILQHLRHRSAGRPVEQFDRVDDRYVGALADLRDAADVAGGDQVGLGALDVRHFSLKLLFLVLNRSEKEWTMPAREWCMAKAQFAILFGERFTRAMA
jgi:hypothetical protein